MVRNPVPIIKTVLPAKIRLYHSLTHTHTLTHTHRLHYSLPPCVCHTLIQDCSLSIAPSISLSQSNLRLLQFSSFSAGYISSLSPSLSLPSPAAVPQTPQAVSLTGANIANYKNPLFLPPTLS